MEDVFRYFVQVAYNGANYHGWQRQLGQKTIQEEIETKLSEILHKTTVCIGCGRTDSKVHASQFFFHFNYHLDINFDLVFRLNKNLSDDIAVLEITKLTDDHHAQLSAKSRTYDYLIHFKKDPHLAQLSSLYPFKLNINDMAKAIKLIGKQDNFMNFCHAPSHQNGFICKIVSTKLFILNSGEMIRFQFKANRFLQGMVKILSQTLIDVGRGELGLNELENIFTSTELRGNITPAFPQGLYLSEVNYSFIETPNISSFFSLINNQKWEEVVEI